MTIRVGRWIVPGAGVTLALAGLVFLAVGEVVPELETPVVVRSGTLRPERREAVRARPAPATTPTATPAGSPAPAADRGPAMTKPLPSIAPGRPVVRETRAVLQASPTIAMLAQAPDLVERLQRLEDHLRTLSPGQVVITLRGLLDSELPGDFYEAETLRLRVLARLGEVPGAAADELLIGCLDSDRPRPQRLLAVEVLSARGSAGGPELELIARNDHDAVVQEKARWALAREPRR